MKNVPAIDEKDKLVVLHVTERLSALKEKYITN